MIFGTLEATQPIRDVEIRIYDPNGNLVYKPTIPVIAGEFMDRSARVEASWITDGTYTIEVSNPKLAVTAIKEIEFKAGFDVPVLVTTPSELNISGYPVEHNLVGDILGATVNPDSKTITFELSGDLDSDTFTVNLPSGLITNPNAVWVDGNQITNFETKVNGDITQLVIPISSGSQEVVIMGTYVVPEFGSIAVIILAVAIISVIVVASKSQRFSILKSY